MSRRDRRQRLPSGLEVYGLTPLEVRREHFQVTEYFRPGLEIHPGMTVFDVGANIGLFSLELLRRLDGDARVFAFEPAPKSFELLQRNARELFPNAPISLYRSALGASPGSATLYFRPRLSTLSSLNREPQVDPQQAIDAMLREVPDERYPHRLPPRVRRMLRPVIAKLIRAFSWWMTVKAVEIPVEVRTISQVLRESGVERIDLLKVDVEGAELAVLEGIETEDWPKVQEVSAEVHDIDGRVEKMRNLLESAGFERIHFSQEWPFEGTAVWMLEATREPALSEVADTSSATYATPPD